MSLKRFDIRYIYSSISTFIQSLSFENLCYEYFKTNDFLKASVHYIIVQDSERTLSAKKLILHRILWELREKRSMNFSKRNITNILIVKTGKGPLIMYICEKLIFHHEILVV